MRRLSRQAHKQYETIIRRNERELQTYPIAAF